LTTVASTIVSDC